MSNHRASWLRRALAVPLAVLFGAVLAGCAVHWPSVHWPWKHHAPTAPPAVQELAIEPPGQILQYWDRNALLLDLSALGGQGTATLRPAPGHTWPVRLEFRVQPGSLARLEVQAQQRVVFEVPAQGGPTVLKLGYGVYVADTAQIILRWNAADDSAR